MEEESDEPPTGGATTGWRLFALLVRRARGPTDLLEDLLGRSVRSRLLDAGELSHVAPPGLVRLGTEGPVLRRHLVLTDSLPPHLPVAVSWSVVVPSRLPADVAAAVRSGAEPLDRLLDERGLTWTADPVETEILPAGEASVDFRWAAPGARLVEQARVLRLGSLPVATVLDEIPYLPPLDPDTPLLPYPAGPSRGDRADLAQEV
jgi:hypothetical protein